VGQIYTVLGRFQEALESYQQGLQIAEDHGLEGKSDAYRTWNYLGALYLQWGRKTSEIKKFEQAKSYFENVLSKGDTGNKIFAYPGLAKLYHYWGLQTNDKTKQKKALEVVAKGFDLEPRNYTKGLLWKFKGCALRELEQYDEAQEAFEDSYTFLAGLKASNLNIISATARLELAKQYIRTGNLEGAQDQMRLTIKAIREFDATFDVTSIHDYFATSIANMERGILFLSQGETDEPYRLIQQLLDSIQY
jgi:tetratricopeptide (TPR) repeat protein